MNWLGKIGFAFLLLGFLCYISLFVGAITSFQEYVYDLFKAGVLIGVFIGFILLFISVLYDRYKQLETEEVRPRV